MKVQQVQVRLGLPGTDKIKFNNTGEITCSEYWYD